jgi:hypothetical protein
MRISGSPVSQSFSTLSATQTNQNGWAISWTADKSTLLKGNPLRTDSLHCGGAVTGATPRTRPLKELGGLSVINLLQITLLRTGTFSLCFITDA